MAALPPGVLVGLGGAIGALARHGVAERVETARFPAATFAVNVTGSFVLALVTFASVPSNAGLLLGTGACGAFTTYSTLAYDTVAIGADETGWLHAGLYAAGTLAAALAAAGLAWLLVA